MASGITEATKENFRDLVSEGVSVVDVWGPSCQPCFALMPHFERLAQERPQVRALKLEAPSARRLCMELRLLGLPVFLLFSEGQEVSRLDGADITPERLERWLDDNLQQLGAGKEVIENAEGTQGRGVG